jgi:hypothetical protein
MENQFRVIVTGDQDFYDYQLFYSKLNTLLSHKENVVILANTERGAMGLAVKYAKQNGMLISYYPLTWKNGSTPLIYERNEQMAKNADACVCFWDGESNITKHMIDTAKSMQIPVRVINY